MSYYTPPEPDHTMLYCVAALVLIILIASSLSGCAWTEYHIGG